MGKLINKKEKPVIIFFKEKDVPHLVIEVNQKCNISCVACYKNHYDYTKPIELIKEEIDYALTKRKVRGITLAGGEPTLHPRLTEIIDYISKKGIAARILTNGLNFKEEQLKAYKNAGLSDVFLHIDSMQNRPDFKRVQHENELNLLREKICKKVIAAGLNCKLAVTLYQKNLSDFNDLVSYVLQSKIFDRMLITCYTDFRKIAYYYNNDIQDFDNNEFDKQTVRNFEVEDLLYNKLKMVPYAYIASSHSMYEKRWLYYGAAVIHKKNGRNALLHFTPAFKYIIKLLNKVSKLKQKRVNLRDVRFFERFIVFDFFCAFLFSDFKILIKTILFLNNMLTSGAQMSIKNFIFQQGPNLRSDGKIEYCRNCPDATVRDGKLTILCMADLIKKEKRIEL